MNKSGMTKQDLELAQFLKNTVDRASYLAEHIESNSKRKDNKWKVMVLDAILFKASDGFTALVGRSVHKVQVNEINSVSPAEWTQKPMDEWSRR
jgi:hypothetical protein